jgi:HPt (histidine-containing phosphotransfer) domain-containing protein
MTAIVDWDQLLSLREVQAPDEPDVVEQIIEMFLEDSDVRLSRAREALASTDAAALRLQAHSLRGTAGLIGAEHLRAAAEVVEYAAPAGDWPSIEIAFGTMVAAVGEVREELVRFASAAGAPPDPAHL